MNDIGLYVAATLHSIYAAVTGYRRSTGRHWWWGFDPCHRWTNGRHTMSGHRSSTSTNHLV